MNEPNRNQRGHQRSKARSERQGNFSKNAPSARTKKATNTRDVVFEVLTTVADADAYANLVLPATLKRHDFSSTDRGFITELTYGTLRLQGRYDAIIEICAKRQISEIDPKVRAILRLGAHQLLAMRVPAHAAVNETVALARDKTGAGSAQFVNAILRRISEKELEAWLDYLEETLPDEVSRYAATESHPRWIVRALKDSLVANGRPADELLSVLEAQNKTPKVNLVARPGLIDAEELSEIENMKPGNWVKTAYTLNGGDPQNIKAVSQGRLGVQDEGSQIVTEVFLQAPVNGKDEYWLDMCAGPGGKTALLGAYAAGRGARVVANEVQEHRANLVAKSVKALPDGAIERIQVWDGRDIGNQEPETYDRVLLDAPCTGLGALRRRPESRWRKTPADLTYLRILQSELLTSALLAVRKGGVVGYVTCSPHLAETIEVVKETLQKFAADDFELIDVNPLLHQVVGPEIPSGNEKHLQLWPHLHQSDAMHLSLIRRK